MRAVLLGAGEGKRMRPLTARRPKVMLPVAGKPIMAWTAERLVGAGATELVIVTHYQEKSVRDWFRKNPIKGARVRFVHQAQPAGTGHALASLRGGARSEFLLVYGDVVIDPKDLVQLARKEGAAIGAFKVDDARPYGSLRVKGKYLQRIDEKSPRPSSRLVNAGAYRLTPDVVEIAKDLPRSRRGEFELTDALNAYVAKGGGVRVQRLANWRDAAWPWDLLTLQEGLMKDWRTQIRGTVEKGAVLHGPVTIGEGTVVKTGTYIEGPVAIGRDCRIGPRSYLRPSTSIGDACHVGASVEIKNSILMERTHVPHLSYVGDSVVGSDVNLGAGTNVANLKLTPTTVRVTLEDGTKLDTGRRKLGAIIGDGTKVGINCSINVGTVLGNDCLVTLGRVVSGWVKPGSRIA